MKLIYATCITPTIGVQLFYKYILINRKNSSRPMYWRIRREVIVTIVFKICYLLNKTLNFRDIFAVSKFHIEWNQDDLFYVNLVARTDSPLLQAHSVAECLWCQQKTMTTSTNYFILPLQLIIAIISINSILAWHLAWLIPFSLCCPVLDFGSHPKTKCQPDSVLKIANVNFLWISHCSSSLF